MKKNVAILIQHLTGGGAERVASNLSLYLPEEKFNKYIIVNDGELIDYSYKGKLIDLETKSNKSFFGKMLNIFIRIFKLRKIKKEYNIDVTISLLSSSNIINILTRRNDKIIVSVRNYISERSTGLYEKLNRILIKVIYNSADVVVPVSESIKVDLIKNYNVDDSKINVINNFYNILKIIDLGNEDIEKENSSIFQSPTIITAGRFNKQKGHWHLIRAFNLVKEKVPNAKLIILGQGELEGYLKQLALDLNIGEDVHFLGFKSNPFKYIMKSSLFVLSSLFEGFPNVLCEAMACGVPVIAADCNSGPREILAPKTNIELEAVEAEFEEFGTLVPVCDGNIYNADEKPTKEERVLGETMIKLLTNDRLLGKYRNQAMKRVADFEKEKIINLWEDIITESAK